MNASIQLVIPEISVTFNFNKYEIGVCLFVVAVVVVSLHKVSLGSSDDNDLFKSNDLIHFKKCEFLHCSRPWLKKNLIVFIGKLITVVFFLNYFISASLTV